MTVTIRCDECRGDADSEQICRHCYELLQDEIAELKKDIAKYEAEIVDLENTPCPDCGNAAK